MRTKGHLIKLLCLAILIILAVPSLFIFTASADNAPTPPEITDGGAYCLFDKTHKKMIISENATEILNTSTSAKVMMGLIACEELSSRLDEVVTITDSMLAGSGGYSMRLQAGENIKIIDLLYGAICGSYNDAAYVLASVCGGSSERFVERMNQKAKALGATSTNYVNPIGYPDNDAMVTTLSDTLQIALAASENQLYMEISSAKHHDIGATNLSAERTVYNRNYLISSRSTQAYYNSACKGMNAGISGQAGGWSIVTLATDESTDYICIVLGGSENVETGEIYAYKTVNTLIGWASAAYNDHQIFKKGQVLGQTEVGMTALGSKKVEVVASDDFSVYIPDGSSPNLNYKIEYVSEKLNAPIKAGEKIGVASVYCNGELVGKCDVVLTEDCEANIIMKAIGSIGEYTRSRAFILTLIFIIIALPIVIVKEKRRSYGARRRRRKY